MGCNEMIRPFYFERPNVCNNCKTRSLELYNMYDKPLNIAAMICNNELEMAEKLNARYFKCKKCGQEYPIQWIDKKPYPLQWSTYQLFFDQFKSVFGKHI